LQLEKKENNRQINNQIDRGVDMTHLQNRELQEYFSYRKCRSEAGQGVVVDDPGSDTKLTPEQEESTLRH